MSSSNPPSEPGGAASSGTNPAVWYVHNELEVQGPLPQAEFARRLASGAIAPHWLVRRGDAGNWMEARRVKLKRSAAPKNDNAGHEQVGFEEAPAGIGRGLKIALAAVCVVALGGAFLFVFLKNGSIDADRAEKIYAEAVAAWDAGDMTKAKQALDQYAQHVGRDPAKADALLAKLQPVLSPPLPPAGVRAKAVPHRPDDWLEVIILNDAPKDIEPPAPRKLRIAVTPPGYDAMGVMLTKLGEGYAHFRLIDDAELARSLTEVDLLFLTCRMGGKELRHDLEKWVSRGGILYASDLRYEVLAETFPDLVDLDAAGYGNAQELDVDVLDLRLREIIGPVIRLDFESTGWRPAAFKGPGVETLLHGAYRGISHKAMEEFNRLSKARMLDPKFRFEPTALRAPLMVKFPYGKGVVFFTSFHNARINSEIGQKLLETLVFSIVTAEVEAQIVAVVGGKGFKLLKQQLLTFEKADQVQSTTFTLPDKGPLRAALGFRREGARFELTFEAAGKKPWMRQVDSTLILEFPTPPTVEWRCRVKALELPYPNFPFQLTFGQAKKD